MTTQTTPIDISPLAAIVGEELELGLLSATLSEVVGTATASTIGAVHITCADEAQHRVIEKVQELLVERHVTPMASGERTAFRLINLGGHHEFGALGLAEEHWSGATGEGDEPKLMVVRADAHVGVDSDPAGRRLYGRFLRFGRTSVACGALASVLRGVAVRGGEGFVDSNVRARRILEAFPEHTNMLAAAVCRAELSAADCLAEIDQLDHASPTAWLVVATVTLNHPDRHASMLTSVHLVGPTTVPQHAELGTDVERYVIDHHGESARISLT